MNRTPVPTRAPDKHSERPPWFRRFARDVAVEVIGSVLAVLVLATVALLVARL